MMKQTLMFILTMFTVLVFLTPSVFAANKIDIIRMSLSDTQPTIGDVVRVDFEFRVNAARYSKVDIYLSVDGKLYDKKTETLKNGDYKRSLYIDTYDLKRETYNVKIEAKIYDENERVDDRDTKNKYLYVKGEIKDSRTCYHYYDDYYNEYYDNYYYDGYCYTYVSPVKPVSAKDHHITITQISYDHSASKYEKIPIKVYVKNEGDYSESVKIDIEIDGIKKTTDRELIYPGDERAMLVYFTAPSTTGTHAVKIKATSYYDQHIVEDFIDLIGTTISLDINPKTAKIGEWVHVYGYAMDGVRGIATPVSIYKDSAYLEQVSVKPTGYYSAYVRFYDSGEHMIRIKANGIEKTKQIYIEYSEPAATTSAAPVTPVTIAKEVQAPIDSNNYNTVNNNITNKYYTIIVLSDENKTIDVDGTDIQITVEKPRIPNNLEQNEKEIIKKTNELPEYVSVDINSKTLNIKQYGGNTLKLIITNHMRNAQLFSVETDFDETLVYLPEPSVINPEETKILPLYFSSMGKTGKTEGVIRILKGDETIKEIPIIIYSLADTKSETPAVSNKLYDVNAIIVMLFLTVVITFSYFIIRRNNRKKFERPLEPKIMLPPIGNYDSKNKLNSQYSNIHRTPRKNIKEIYEVPWDNIIY